MKILYILGAYKPNMSANGVCSDNVINQLLEEGHEVTALVNSAPGASKSCKDGALTVVRVKQRLSAVLTEKSEALTKTNPLKAKLFGLLGKIINKTKLLITAPWWPVVSPSTVSRFKRAAINLHKENRFDAVVSVYTPVEALLAGYGLKKAFPEIKFYPYFLDSLSGGFGPRYFSKKRIIRRGLNIEKRVFPLAERIIVMQASRQHHEKYNEEFLSKMSFLEVPSFCKRKTELISNPEKKDGSPIRLLYVGSISYAVRDPRALIRVLCEMQEDNTVCEFVGKIDCPHLFDSLKQKLGDRLVLSGQLSHDEVIKKITNADVLLNIGNKLSTMIPSKIFEYISYAKPIISTYVSDEDPSLPHLKLYPLSLLLDCRSSENFGDKITEFLKKIENIKVDENELERIYRLNSPEAFTEIITRECFLP